MNSEAETDVHTGIARRSEESKAIEANTHDTPLSIAKFAEPIWSSPEGIAIVSCLAVLRGYKVGKGKKELTI